MARVEVAGLSVQFGGVVALASVELDVAPHSVHAIVGPNGAGKSTLLNAINGFVPIANGSVTIGGERVEHRSAARIANMGVRRSFQNPRLVETLSVQENLMYGLYDTMSHSWLDQVIRPIRVRRQEREARAHTHELLRAVSLERDANLPVACLPYGIKKLVEILRALVPKPDIVLLDEPSSGLGAAERGDLSTMLQNYFKTTPTTAILVEHHMDVVTAVATNATVLRAGSVADSGPVEQVLALPQTGGGLA